MNKPTSALLPSRLAVTYRAFSDLIPDPRNARTHPKRQIDQIRASIEAFGFTNPILADPNGHIIAGHGRVQAARAMGPSELPIIILSGLSETQKRTLQRGPRSTRSARPCKALRTQLGVIGADQSADDDSCRIDQRRQSRQRMEILSL